MEEREDPSSQVGECQPKPWATFPGSWPLSHYYTQVLTMSGLALDYLASLLRLGFSGRTAGLWWRPQGSPFMILAWAAPHLQETPPFQQEEFRLRHFQLPAWATGGVVRRPLTQWWL